MFQILKVPVSPKPPDGSSDCFGRDLRNNEQSRFHVILTTRIEFIFKRLLQAETICKTQVI